MTQTSVAAAPAGQADIPRISSGRASLALAVVGFAAFMVSMSQGLLIPVLAVLPAELNTTHTNVEWLLTSTLLVAAVAVPVMGRMGDMFGKRRLLLIAMGMLVAGSAICALTSNVAVMIVGRCVQGLSTATIPLGISLVASLLPRERAGSGIALISSMLGVGAALSLPLAGLIAEHADFHVLFWITVVGAALSFVATLAVVPESSHRTGGRVDLVGTALLTAGLVALMLPLAETANWGWGSPRVIGLLALGVVLLVVLGLVERRIQQPLVDMKAFLRRPLLLTNLASLLFGFALFASMIGTASFVQAPAEAGYGFGSSMIVGGLAMVPSGLGMLLLAPVAARLVARFGGARILALAGVIVSVGWGGRILFSDELWRVIVGNMIVGIGTGIGYAAMPSLINSFTPPTELAAANGLNTLFRAIGSSLASAIGGSILAARTVSVGSAELPSLTGYQQLFGLCSGAAVIAALAALTIPRPAVRRPVTVA